jgi:hypothetical protein
MSNSVFAIIRTINHLGTPSRHASRIRQVEIRPENEARDSGPRFTSEIQARDDVADNRDEADERI